MSRPPSSPTEAADLHLRLLTEHRTTWYHEYTRRFWETYYGDNTPLVEGGMRKLDDYGQESSVGMQEFADNCLEKERHHANDSETVFVTADICHVLNVMSKGMPEDMLLPEDIPYENAMFFLAQDYEYREWNQPDDSYRPRKIRAIQVANNQPVKSWGSPYKPGIVITLYCPIDDIDIDREPDSNIVPIEMTGWQFNCMWSANDVISPVDAPAPHTMGLAIANMRKFVLTLLRFMQEEIVQVSRERLNRACQRRCERAGFHIPEDGTISVVHLRRVRTVGSHGHESREVAWTHRWWVAGHHRNLDYLEPGRTTWVRPHLKGPEEAPIVMKHRVIDVHR
jgi:hypothetical protein